MTDKYDELIESYVNGNISYVRKEFKKMSSQDKAKLLNKATYELSESDLRVFMSRMYV